MNDEALIIRVARGAEEIGEFYLSFIELSLKNGTLLAGDWGWIEGMSRWDPLSDLAANARKTQGKKRLATTPQRNYLKRCAYEPWRGISNREASHLIDSLQKAYEFPPGSWIKQPITDAQIHFLQDIGATFNAAWTKGEASVAITQRLAELDSKG